MGIRITGMASGMDTEKMVKDLMKAQREPVNRLQRNKYSVEWKRDAYREMNTVLADLQNSMKNLRMSSSFNKKVATSENDSIVSVTSKGTPAMASYAIEVIELAKASTPPKVEFDPGTTDPKTKSDSNFTLTLKKGTETINLDITTDDSLESMINKINSSSAGVKATFFNGKLVMSSEDGATFNVSTSNVNNNFKISDTPSSVESGGTEAIFKINGVEYKSKTNTISFDGMDITLKQKNAGNPLVISTKTDVDSVYNMVKEFVDKYNAVIETINKKISEPKYKGYQPLLDEEKEALNEKTAEKMDNMARSGILLRDPILTSGLTELRRALSTPVQATGVNTAFDTLSEIGIGGPPPGKYAYQENGKLHIDENKLREAIRNNGEDVLKLFTNYSPEKTDLNKKFQESGVAERLYNQLDKIMGKITKEAGASGNIYDESSLGKKLKQTDEEIERWEDRLKMIEDRYWKQFTAMEKAMSKAQSQGSWFAQMLGQR
ncbi:flagellar filament capping protein FliD [Brevibacillus formosus]|uniref:flagellar filament capping protein FliD n=1 Tax=Brevibacillus formosus TaxID=54913 RepID=UPI001CA472E5|nr:flagellar filament capping protein FliD [Brevibacillus formosus]MBW5468694.1 flagellar filament capping protein FliD [Brevibacillus formosus]